VNIAREKVCGKVKKYPTQAKGLNASGHLTTRTMVDGGVRIAPTGVLATYRPTPEQMLWIDFSGAIASALGLITSIWVLLVARGARAAAEQARSVARRRNLLEELDAAEHKLQELGTFIQQEEWVGIQIRTAEILAECRSAMTRWSDQLPEERRNDVLTAAQLVHSIATRASELSVADRLLPADKKKLVGAHLKASGLLNDALGEARRQDERGIDRNGN
jgi:hypothetical protein